MARTKTIHTDLAPVDQEVDRVFGEPVVLRPMMSVSSGYRDRVPDDTRITLVARGIFDQSRGAVEQTGGGTMHTQATVDTSLSIRIEPVRQVQLRKGDRVFFPERDETHEVTFIHDDPGGRPDVHLVRVIEE
jgi:hypothetical protein